MGDCLPSFIKFGTDGIRGRYGLFPITSACFCRVSYSYAVVMRRLYPSCLPIVLIGRDTRASGVPLSEGVIAGLMAAGIEVWDIGVVSTPIISSLVCQHSVLGGIVVSASHNPYYDNGLKFFSHDGFKLSSSLEDEITSEFNGLDENIYFASRSSGAIHKRYDLLEKYLNDSVNHFSEMPTSIVPCRVAVDCAHGALYRVAPLMFQSLGFEVLPICCSPNGYNVNNLCGSTSPDFLANFVRSGKADVGVCFDADGDRVLLIMPDGNVCDGNIILYLFFRRWLMNSTVSGVVGTVMTNSAIENFFKSEGVSFYRSLVGDKNIVKTMILEKATFGGEPSGHLIVNRDNRLCFDALFNVIDLILSFHTLDDIYQEYLSISLYPQKLLNVRIKKHYNWEDDVRLQYYLDDCRKAGGDFFRVLVRLSGTEPVLRIMLEAKEERFINVVASHLSCIVNAAQDLIVGD
ncbi:MULTISPECIES: hypothetical protein [Candidatus Ichthyocystis]|uniref:Phosphoglucosamine mutase n=1 Tax=Candidatus Ichthyocystis hellenicum TaxID=1561003 RepID=A0A0S4M242_9BURK|nr:MULTISPECIES: hypothetical protein [Ichthyocystis]CUT17833.1 Phosphoglucosamine mutase [Candidatus Ichthyocystis hellenicum]